MDNSISIITDPAEIQSLIRAASNIEKVFSDPVELIHHLTVFRSNPNNEWYNLALIASDKRLRDSGFSIVRPEEFWGSDINQFGRSGDGIRVLWPDYDAQSKKFFWSRKNLYSILDFGLKEPLLERDVDTPLRCSIRTCKLDDIIPLQPSRWQMDLFDQYLDECPEYRDSDLKLRGFFKSSLIMAWGCMLGMNTKLRKEDLTLDAPLVDLESDYMHLVRIITGFIPFIVNWMMIKSKEEQDVHAMTVRKLYGDQ